jgi:hypothetical protein
VSDGRRTSPRFASSVSGRAHRADRTGTRSGADGQPPQRQPAHVRGHPHVGNTPAQPASANQPTRPFGDPSRHATRTTGTIVGVRRRPQRRQIGGSVCAMPSRPDTTDHHRHDRREPDDPENRQHPQRPRSSITSHSTKSPPNSHRHRLDHIHDQSTKPPQRLSTSTRPLSKPSRPVQHRPRRHAPCRCRPRACRQVGSVAATAWARSVNGGNRPAPGGSTSTRTVTRVNRGSWRTSTLAAGGAARATSARTAGTGSPRAAARAPARAASTQATCAAAALTPHRATTSTNTRAGRATAVSTVIEPRSERPARLRHCPAVPGRRRPRRAVTRTTASAAPAKRPRARPDPRVARVADRPRIIPRCSAPDG